MSPETMSAETMSAEAMSAEAMNAEAISAEAISVETVARAETLTPVETLTRAEPLAPIDPLRRGLTDEQERAAARREGSLLLAAGAGSGKTAVLVERFVRALREDGVAPGRILAITFTERAAGELRERVRSRLLELGEREAARAADAAFVCTFHGFCARLLRAHPFSAGVEPGFQVLDEALAGRLRALAFGEALAAFLDGERAEAVDIVAAYGADPLRALVLGAYAHLRSEGQSEPRLPTRAGDAHAVQACALIDELLARFGASYAARKRARGVLDFDDLELLARALLRAHPDVRGAWRERFELLMVDEYQDSNPRQLQVLALLDRDNLFTVGDELQSIYGFRHADVTLFRERRERLGERGASLALTRNFRSQPAILAAVERVFAARMGERFTPLTPTRPGTEDEPVVELLLTDKRGWESEPQDAAAGAPPGTPWRQAEARLLAHRIAELLAGGHARAGEIVVLLRALGDLPVYEDALRRRGLRTLAGIGGFWSDQQVGDLLAWLRALANPLDELALYSALASPLVGVSSDGLALIADTAARRGEGAWHTIEHRAGDLERVLPPPDRRRVAGFRELFAAERSTARLRPLAELLRGVILATGYEARVLSLLWGERRLANVRKLVGLARDFEAGEGRDLRGFLDHVAHSEGPLGGREADAPACDGELDAVRLMSIHAAKGLEFPVVCVADLGREPNLRVPDLLVDGAGGRVGLRLPGLGDPEPKSMLDYDELREQRRAAQEQEEDRVLYVACTRARDRLVLSGAIAFERWGGSKQGAAPICWLAPALVPDAAGLASSGGRAGGELTVDAGDGLLVRCVLNTPDAAADAPAPTSRGRGESLPPADGTAVSGATPVPASRATRESPPVAEPSLTAEPLEDPDGTISYTTLAERERCGYRYYLERILRLPENPAGARDLEDDGGQRARVRGRIVHGLLESIDFAHPRTPSSEDVQRVARGMGARPSAAERERIVGMLAAALSAAPARALRAARGVRAEHPFAFSLDAGEPLVTGVIDLIAERPGGGTLIVDYKSDRVGEEEDLERLVRRDYGIQRLLYALAAIEDGSVEVEVAHWFLERPTEWVSARFQAGERERLRRQLRERLARVRARGFAVTEAPNRGVCLTCPGRGGLCSWGESHTMSE
jgi:ATP-dependent helicase/nuclease subunit A